jgi:hypothetical protein
MIVSNNQLDQLDCPLYFPRYYCPLYYPAYCPLHYLAYCPLYYPTYCPLYYPAYCPLYYPAYCSDDPNTRTCVHGPHLPTQIICRNNGLHSSGHVHVRVSIIYVHEPRTDL